MVATFVTDPDDTREQILAATYRALSTHGYADLTISTIGEEFEKSPSLVYRHYDSKDDLVLSCLSYMLDQFETRLTEDEITDPRARLTESLTWSFGEDLPAERQQFIATLVELRAQTIHDEDYSSHFARSDRVFENHVAAIVHAGIEQDVFQDCNPDQVASTLITTAIGVMLRRSTQEPDSTVWLTNVRNEIETFLDARVYKE
ncbi:TetR/AcrR family transcriptional regulator [Natrialbaceae archaeon A-arb3/5]